MKISSEMNFKTQTVMKKECLIESKMSSTMITGLIIL